jgi:hypothetical protein
MGKPLIPWAKTSIRTNVMLAVMCMPECITRQQENPSPLKCNIQITHLKTTP